MKPSERAVMDQVQAFIRDEADRDELAGLLGDRVFAAGVTFALGMAVRRLDVVAPFDASLAIVDLRRAWAGLTCERFGL